MRPTKEVIEMAIPKDKRTMIPKSLYSTHFYKRHQAFTDANCETPLSEVYETDEDLEQALNAKGIYTEYYDLDEGVRFADADGTPVPKGKHGYDYLVIWTRK